MYEELYSNVRKRYFSKINNIKENFYTIYNTLNPNGEDKKIPIAPIYEYVSSTTFNKELYNDNTIIYTAGKNIDNEIVQVKILYFNNKPILCNWESDGYWYSYDYYNKEKPITTKIDLDYIIDVRQFTYDTGETITLFVDIEGNLHEI